MADVGGRDRAVSMMRALSLANHTSGSGNPRPRKGPSLERQAAGHDSLADARCG